MSDNVIKELTLPGEGEYFEGDSGSFHISRVQLDTLDPATLDMIASVMMLEAGEKELDIHRAEDVDGMTIYWSKAPAKDTTFLGELSEHMSVVPVGDCMVPKKLLMEDFGSPEVLYEAVKEFANLSQMTITIEEKSDDEDHLFFSWEPAEFTGTNVDGS